MKRLYYKLLLIFIFIPGLLFAQKESNNWYFGNNAAITFNNGAPQAVSGSAMTQREGNATISDPQGNLMFYTDGITVWNSQNQVMPNGNGLGGENIATQSAVIVPLPQSKTRYYIFTVDDWQNTGGSLQYSIVDMAVDGGRGDVVTKNVLVNTKVREQVTSVYSGSNCNVWILTHETGNNNFDAYLLTDAGLQTTPVVSSVGQNYVGYNRYGYLKFSPNGKRVAAELGHPDISSDITIQLLDFDNQTGIVSNPVNVAENNILFDAYSLEFSPDGNVLYATASSFNPALYQFDLSSGNSATIEASVLDVGSGSAGKTCVQLGPDKKIYVSKDGVSSLGVINNPNVLGTGCNYVDNAVNLGSGTGRLGFPNFVQSFFIYPSLGKKEYDLCAGQRLDVDVSTDPRVVYEWQDGTTGPKYSITQNGTYWVKATFDNCTRYDTTVANFTPLPVIDLGKDTILCDGTALLLNAGNPGATYVWQDASAASTFNVTQPGTYQVTVTANSCSASDAIDVTYSPIPAVNLGKDTALCAGQPLALKNAYTGIPDFLWQDGSTNDHYDVTAAGKYWLRETLNGCANTDTLVVTSVAYPVVDLGADTTLCEGSTLLLQTINPGATYRWQDGSATGSFKVSAPGTFSVTANVQGCKTTDEINVAYSPLPVVDLGGDAVYCASETVLLNAGTSGANDFLWQDGSTVPTYNVTQAGTYWVRVVDAAGCTNTDTVRIAYDTSTVGLSTLVHMCLDQPLLLDASQFAQTTATYKWQDGSTQSTLLVRWPGRYTVQVSTSCKTLTDTVLVGVRDCSCHLEVPDAFSPNGDGHNDIFRPLMTSCAFTVYNLSVYNRVGNLIFQTSDPAMGWDGNVKGRYADVAAYVYLLQYQTTAGSGLQMRKGTVMLVR